MKAVIITGLPGSGKSVAKAQWCADTKNAHVISIANINDRLSNASHKMRSHAEAAYVISEIATAQKLGLNVCIVGERLLDPMLLAAIEFALSSNGYAVDVKLLDSKIDVCRQRLLSMHKTLDYLNECVSKYAQFHEFE